MSKSNTNRERREMVEQMRQQARASERRRTLAVVAGCLVVALIIVGFAGYALFRDKQAKDALAEKQLSDLGAAADAAGCLPIVEANATGAGDHTTDPVVYDTVPPAYGKHNPVAADLGIHIYDSSDRPPVEKLVHNLEHGWTIVWYDDTVAGDDNAMQDLQATADKFDAHGNDPRYDLIIAPWTADDGEGRPIPDDKHIAFTHWSIHQPTYDPQVFSGANQNQTQLPSFGESEYCTTFSGAALDSFTKKFPYDDAPEGFLWHQ